MIEYRATSLWSQLHLECDLSSIQHSGPTRCCCGGFVWSAIRPLRHESRLHQFQVAVCSDSPHCDQIPVGRHVTAFRVPVKAPAQVPSASPYSSYRGGSTLLLSFTHATRTVLFNYIGYSSTPYAPAQILLFLLPFNLHQHRTCQNDCMVRRLLFLDAQLLSAIEEINRPTWHIWGITVVNVMEADNIS